MELGGNWKVGVLGWGRRILDIGEKGLWGHWFLCPLFAVVYWAFGCSDFLLYE